ncbi:DASS family sodium-coupled anion symporter [Gelria sp. Kuro-4]|uniref:SLC13 family permease n=1 Tax=Gelria sp. Kuro-4 TaxID=2796927 RepID=UPI001BF10492|nr:DASS family sodium-coupled anion symporter [Gelria sp. Kuro-4]BCV25580.1 sodium:sulfate symporter [Gelria sp. Kuro-4]
MKTNGTWRYIVMALMALIALFIALYPFPGAAGLSPAGKYVLAVFVLAVGLWVAAPAQYLTPASLLVLVLVVLALSADKKTAAKAVSTGMSGYGDAGLWLMILGFVYATAFSKSGLAKRVALVLMNLARGSSFWILFMVGVINIAISATTPSTIAKGGLLLPVIVGIVGTAGVEKGKSNFAKAIGIYAGAADNIISAGILTATIANPLAISILKKAAGIDVSWTQWFLYTFPMVLVSTLLAFFLVYFLFPPEIKEINGGAEYVAQELRSLGPVTSAEKVTLMSFLTALALWILDKSVIGVQAYRSLPAILQTILGLHVFVKGLFAAMILFVPRYGVVTWKDAEKDVPWGTYVLFGAALGLSAALNQTKGMDWAVMHILNALGLKSLPFFAIYALIVFLMYYGHVLFFTYTAMAAALLPIVISLAKALSLPVLALYVPAMTLIPYSCIFPFNTVPLLMFNGAGLFETRDSAAFGLLFGLVVLAQWFLIGLPYWRALGIMP